VIPKAPVAIPAESSAPRRVLSTRDACWAKVLARRLGRVGVRPNIVSVAGVAFAAAGCAAFATAPGLAPAGRAVALLVAAVAIQLRLLCNLLDGMLAIEEGLKSKTGDIYNDLPDRVADIALLAGAGYALRDMSWGPALGWLAAVMAVFTAYVRLLGGTLGARQPFMGPMAKQHRMFTLTVGSLLGALESMVGAPERSLLVSLSVIVFGSIVTVARRTSHIVREVEAR
jgi:phosphatidylglycerophosphate synthase